MIKNTMRFRIKRTIQSLRKSKDKLSRAEHNVLSNERQRNDRTLSEMGIEITRHERHLSYLFKNRHSEI